MGWPAFGDAGAELRTVRRAVLGGLLQRRYTRGWIRTRRPLSPRRRRPVHLRGRCRGRRPCRIWQACRLRP